MDWEGHTRQHKKHKKKDQDIETKKENSFNSTPNQSLKCHISVFFSSILFAFP